MKVNKTFTILKEGKDSLTVIINGKERRLRRHVKEKYIAPSRRGVKWWRVTGEGRGHSQEMKVTCNGIEYNSLSDCARSIGISKSTVSKILKGQRSKYKISNIQDENN